MSYEVRKIDLSALQASDVQIIPAGKKFSEIAILYMPAGSSFQLRLGQANPLIPIFAGTTFEPTEDDENNSGIYWQNDAAQAGTVVYITIAYGGQLRPILL